MSEKQKKIVSILAIFVFLAVCAAVGWFVGRPMVALAEDPDQFRDWVDSYGVWGKAAYVFIVVVQVIVAFIPGEPLELAGGYAFGWLEGTILSLLGIVLGSMLVFGLVRRFGVKLVEVFFSRDKINEVAFLKNPKKTRVIAFILMMIPGTPKDFLSYFAGLTQMRLKEWLLIVTIARIPSVITSTISGGAAGSENYLLAGITLAVTVLISIAGGVYYRRICVQQNEEENKAKKIA